MTRDEYVQLTVDDGSGAMRAYVAHPEGPGPPSGTHPGMLVIQEALGVNAQIRSVCARWAARGFVAIAPEMFHRVSPAFEADTLQWDVLMPLLKTLTTDGMIADVRAAHAWLAARDDVDVGRVACVGFC